MLKSEISILEAGIDVQSHGVPEFYSFLIAKELAARETRGRITAHGTLYRALNRMERAGLLASRWEDYRTAAKAHRPLRRLYQVTAIGERAHADASKLA